MRSFGVFQFAMQKFILPESLETYIEDISSGEPELLQRLNRETHLKVLYPRMLSGPVQGRFLSMLTKMLAPKRILEVGTFTGYSALCMGEGLPEEGVIDSIELIAEREWLIRKYLQEARIEDQVNLLFGRALDIIPGLEGPYELVFLDADKANYSTYYELILPKMPSGGILVADNVLWDGKVVDPKVQDKETNGIRNFNQLVRNDNRVEQVLLPLRDGMLMVRKV